MTTTGKKCNMCKNQQNRQQFILMQTAWKVSSWAPCLDFSEVLPLSATQISVTHFSKHAQDCSQHLSNKDRNEVHFKACTVACRQKQGRNSGGRAQGKNFSPLLRKMFWTYFKNFGPLSENSSPPWCYKPGQRHPEVSCSVWRWRPSENNKQSRYHFW